MSERLSEFKHKGRAEEARRARAEGAVSLRKQKRHELASKKRNIDEYKDSPQPVGTSADITQEVQDLRAKLDSPDLAAAQEAVTRLRTLVSLPSDPPLTAVCEAGCIPKLVEFIALTDEQFATLQYESIWTLTNIAAGEREHTEAVAKAGAVPVLISLLFKGSDRIREQATWALGNIAGDSEMTRDFVIECGAVTPLVKLIRATSQVRLLRNASWAATNLCRGKRPPPSFEAIRPFLHILLKLLHSLDDEILINACWCAVFLSLGSTERIQHVIETGACGRLVELLLHEKWAVATPALRALGNIVTGTDIQTQIVMNIGILPSLHSVMTRAPKAVKKECLWVLSNILAGTDDQIQSVIDSNLMQLIIDALEHGEFRLQREAAWAICNALASGTDDQIRFMISQGCLPPLCAMLKMHDTKLVGVVLQGLYSVLTVGKRPPGELNEYHTALEQCGGLETLTMLAVDENENIGRRSRLLLETFLKAEPETMVDMNPDFDGNMYSEEQMQYGPSHYHV